MGKKKKKQEELDLSEVRTESGKKLSLRRHDLSPKKKRIMAGAVAGMVGVCLVGGLVYKNVKNASDSEEDASAYREETAAYGTLTVGVTEDGSVTIGTETQTLDADISAYTSSADTSSGSAAGNANGGGNAMGMGGMGGGTTTTTTTTSTSSSDTRALTVEQVYVVVGQEIEAGDPIALLDTDSVSEIRTDLQEDVTDAQNTYDEVTADAKTNLVTYKQNYEIYSMYATDAQTEYDTSIQKLQADVDSAQEDLDDANEQLTEYQEDLAQDQEDLPGYQSTLKNLEYLLSTIDKEDDMYNYLINENAREEMADLVDTTEDEIETLTDEIADEKDTIKELEQALAVANQAYALGEVTAQTIYDTETAEADTATDYYNSSTGQSDLNVTIALADLNEAQEKLDSFDQYIQNDCIIASDGGIISAVSVAEGDTLSDGSELITVNDYDEVTVSVDVPEDDIDNATLGAAATVYISALPDSNFDATVTEVGDATYDSTTGSTYYTVAVTLSGDDLGDLLEGMTAEVTFITKDTEDVLYVSNRAVTRDNGVSYVKVKDADGNIENREVTTGFSDGTNVEITDGLTEGETVVIESSASSTEEE